MVGITISGNCSFGRVTNWYTPISDTKMISRYMDVLLFIAQLVGLNSLNFSLMFSKALINQKFAGNNYACGHSDLLLGGHQLSFIKILKALCDEGISYIQSCFYFYLVAV